MLELVKGEVVPIDDCHLGDNPLNALYTNSRNKGKKFYHEAIRYAYYMYKKNGIYANLFPKERARVVSKTYFGDTDYYKKFELNTSFTAFKNYYTYIQYDATERTLLKTEEDIEKLLDHLNEIDYYIKRKVEVEIHIPVSKDSKETVSHLHTEWVNISNFDEKKKALAAVKDILSVRKTLKDEIKSREVEKRNTDGMSLMDQGFFDEE